MILIKYIDVIKYVMIHIRNALCNSNIRYTFSLFVLVNETSELFKQNRYIMKTLYNNYISGNIGTVTAEYYS